MVGREGKMRSYPRSHPGPAPPLTHTEKPDWIEKAPDQMPPTQLVATSSEDEGHADGDGPLLDHSMSSTAAAGDGNRPSMRIAVRSRAWRRQPQARAALVYTKGTA